MPRGRGSLCRYCHERISCKKKHIEAVHPELVCLQCGKKKFDMKLHYEAKHGPNKLVKIQCSHCNKKKIGLKQHIDAMHSHIKPVDRLLGEQLLRNSESSANQRFSREANQTLDRLVKFLQHESNLNVKETVKGGSLAKGTALTDKADIDVVVFLNDSRDMTSFINGGHTRAMKNLEKQLKASEMHKSENLRLDGCTKYAVKLQLRANRQSNFFDVDVLPAFDNLGSKSKKAMYDEMKDKSPADQEYYSSSLVKLQRDFVKSKPAPVKELIRLVKDWRKTLFENFANRRLPTSYLLELITIKVWEEKGRQQRFDEKSMFREVLDTLTKPGQIEACWNVNYKPSQYEKEICRDRPFVLDPANPFNNVASRCDKQGWDEVVRVARATMSP